MKLAEVLSGPETWCRGWWEKEQTGERCILGALAAMLVREGAPKFSYVTESHRLAQIIGLDEAGLGLINWNNAPERTWDDIASLVEEYDRDRMLHP